MEVKYALARVRTHIPEETVAAIGDALAAGDLACHPHHPLEQRAILRLLNVDAWDMAARHDQDMDWGDRIPISNSHYSVVHVDKSAREGSAHYSAERAVWIEI
jgi:hypothetical protein